MVSHRNNFNNSSFQTQINNNSIIIFMWANQNQVCYESYLINCYHQSLLLPLAPLSYQPHNYINSFLQIQYQSGFDQKSYRDTVQEIKQKVTKKAQPERKNKVQKSRFIIKKVNHFQTQEREDNFERKKQTKDRNLPSNICKYFISYLYHHPCLTFILQNTDNTETPNLIHSCISKVKTHIKDNQTYIRPGLIESMCRSDLLGEQEAKILRILFKRFMGCDFKVIVSMMRKLTKKEKLAYFRMGRKFIKKFTGNA